MKKFRIFAVLAIVAAFGFLVPVISAQPTVSPAAVPAFQDPAPTIPTLQGALLFLTTAGGIGVAISFLFEQRAWFQALAPNAKFWIVLAASIGIPLGAKAVLEFVPPDTITSLTPWFEIAALGFGTFLASQWYHKSQSSGAKG